MSIWQRITERARRGKGMFDLHPELEDRIPLLRLYSDEVAADSAGQFSTMALYYAANVWVHKAINVIADNISALRVRVVDADGQEIEGHEITDRLAEPNPEMSPAELWREWAICMMLGGEFGGEVAWSAGGGKKIVELWPRDPQVFDVKTESARYRRVAGYTVRDGNGEPYPLQPDQMIHWKFYNPLMPFRGLAPITAVRMGIVIDQLAQAWSRLFYKNQARPDFALIAPEGVTQSEKKEMTDKLRQEHGGDRVWEPIILENGVTDIKVFSFPPKDMEWVQQREMSRDEIGAIFGVPDEIMGYGRDTYENFDTADRVLWTLTLVPLVHFRDDRLTRWMRAVKALQPAEHVATDLSGVSQLQEDKGKKVEQLATLADKGYPVNVVNEWLGLRLPAIKGGDTGYLPFGMMPVTSLAGGKSALRHGVKLRRGIAEYGSREHEALWKAKQARITSHVEEMQRVLKREFQRQQNEVSRKLRDSKSFGRGQFKADIPPVEELFDYDEEVKKFIKALRASIITAISAVGQASIEEVLDGGLFDVTNPAVQDGIELVLQTVAEKVNDTTWTELIDLFKEAEAAGEGIPAIQERLSAYFGDRKSAWQTERIARTTMTGASNFGSLEAWEQSGVVEGSFWISALQPNRTRDAHAEAHMQFATLGEPFMVGGESLMFPGDSAGGSASNVINCLCSVVPKVQE